MNIRRVKPGDPIKADEWNRLVDTLRSLVVQPGSGIRVTRTPSGTTLAVVPGGAFAAPQSFTHPFKVIVAKNEKGNVRVQVSFGTVSSIEPTLGGQWLHNVRPTPPTLPVEDGSQVFLKANLDASRNVASAEIAAATEVPQNSDTLSHILLARISIAEEGAVTVSQNVASSLGFRTCKNPNWYEGNTEELEYQHIWWGI